MDEPPTDAERQLIRDLTHRFMYHAPVDEETAKRHMRVSKACLEAALVIAKDCPDCRERSVALTKLQEARMMANAAIALNPRKPDGTG